MLRDIFRAIGKIINELDDVAKEYEYHYPDVRDFNTVPVEETESWAKFNIK